MRAEFVGQPALVTAAATGWTLQLDQVPHMTSGYTQQQAGAEFIASRREVSALTGEDGGSMYPARTSKPASGGTIAAGASVAISPRCRGDLSLSRQLRRGDSLAL